MARSGNKPEKRKAIKKNLYMNRYLYLMLLPVVLNFIIFHYIPMGGILMAFENYNPFKGIFGSEWVGFDNFKKLFGSYYFWSLLSNTLRLSIKSILIGFPAPIIFALLLNEMRAKSFKKNGTNHFVFAEFYFSCCCGISGKAVFVGRYRNYQPSNRGVGRRTHKLFVRSKLV